MRINWARKIVMRLNFEWKYAYLACEKAVKTSGYWLGWKQELCVPMWLIQLSYPLSKSITPCFINLASFPPSSSHHSKILSSFYSWLCMFSACASQAERDTRSIFESTFWLKSQFSFYYIHCSVHVQKPSQFFFLLRNRGRMFGFVGNE